MSSIISVVIPTHGGGQYLENAIQSVLNQTYKSVEIIVVDDNGIGSENQLSTKLIMSKFINHLNIIYHVNDINMNGSYCRNKGVEISNGKYVAFLDDDDVYYPDHLEVGISKMMKSDADMVFSSLRIYKDNKYYNRVNNYITKNVLYNLLLHKKHASSGTMIIKRKVYLELNGFDIQLKRHQDWEFSNRVAFHYKVIGYRNVGLRKNLTYRNSPKSYEVAYTFRMLYLKKILELLDSFSAWKKSKIDAYNKISLTSYNLKKFKIFKFFKDLRNMEINGLQWLYCLSFISLYLKDEIFRKIKYIVKY